MVAAIWVSETLGDRAATEREVALGPDWRLVEKAITESEHLFPVDYAALAAHGRHWQVPKGARRSTEITLRANGRGVDVIRAIYERVLAVTNGHQEARRLTVDESQAAASAVRNALTALVARDLLLRGDDDVRRGLYVTLAAAWTVVVGPLHPLDLG